MSPLTLILVGFLLMVLGILLPLGMMLDVVPATFALCFLAFAASVAGVFMGIVGASRYVARRR